MDLITPLLPVGARPYAKSVVAIVGVVLSILAIVLPTASWVPLAVQIATALGVYATPNAPAPDETFLPED